MAAAIRLPLNVLAQLRLIIRFRVGLEPGDDVGVEVKRELLLDGPIRQAAFGVGPVENLRRVRRVDGLVGHGCRRLQLLAARVNGWKFPSSCAFSLCAVAGRIEPVWELRTLVFRRPLRVIASHRGAMRAQ